MCPECGADGRQDVCASSCSTQTHRPGAPKARPARKGRAFPEKQDQVVPGSYDSSGGKGTTVVVSTAAVFAEHLQLVVCQRPSRTGTPCGTPWFETEGAVHGRRWGSAGVLVDCQGLPIEEPAR